MSEVILTIAIPTYNRARLLETCLTQLAREFGNNSAVEILVSNNASTDDTATIVRQYQASVFPKLHYIENEVNLGPDRNIAQCFREAKGKYVWIFSDDDILLPTYGASIFKLLTDAEWGLIHLKSIWFNQEEIPQPSPEVMQHKAYSISLDFLNQINYWVTFITGNIINKGSLTESHVTYEFLDTNLVQLGWVLPSIFIGLPNALVTTPVLACRANNTGGYKLFQTFATNFNIIMSKFVMNNIMPLDAQKIINNHLISGFFPGFITSNQAAFGQERVIATLYKEFNSYPTFWTKLLPTYIEGIIKSKLRFAKRSLKRVLGRQ
ncbi:glycosyltransferase family 2 protein [Hymenobacter cheonanensis]|uniref:glycosyltransferase family 2 protein n=1 Tax=Hymenobacter sp. CA2-7 TaxID=3063993 RepID=UPI002712E1DE|nr:glycosyltransferase family 2 protein [Hymenobacter sp. CA2-7]MDO7884404.1 glycosyltransferase family 2 protein [Hymenobacter sp. CA2-7]